MKTKNNKKVENLGDGYISTCYKCGKREVVIGPRGKGLCEACLVKSNQPYQNKGGFVNDFDQPKAVEETPKTTRKTRK